MGAAIGAATSDSGAGDAENELVSSCEQYSHCHVSEEQNGIMRSTADGMRSQSCPWCGSNRALEWFDEPGTNARDHYRCIHCTCVEIVVHPAAIMRADKAHCAKAPAHLLRAVRVGRAAGSIEMHCSGCERREDYCPEASNRLPVLQRQLVRTSEDSMLRAHRRHCHVHDFHTSFTVACSSVNARPVPCVARFTQHSGQAAFWFEGSGKDTMIVADSGLFASPKLDVVNATCLQVGETHTVGTLCIPPMMALIDVAELLVAADVVLTYVHIGSTLSMSEAAAPYRAAAAYRFAGTHEYYTNECNVDELSFEVRFKCDGQIVVVGVPAA